MHRWTLHFSQYVNVMMVLFAKQEGVYWNFALLHQLVDLHAVQSGLL